MSVVMPTPDAGVVSRFVAGDENALVALYRQEYDSLLSAAAERLGPELAHFRGRVAHKAMLETWQARERFRNAVGFSAFLEEAVHGEADHQRRRHAALRHREHAQAPPHVEVATVDEAVRELIAVLHAPDGDHARAAEEARVMQRTHAREHVERVAGRPRWLLYGGIAVAVAVAIVGVQRLLDRAGSEVAVDRALTGDQVQHLASGRGQRGTLTLRDGTRATLGSDTRLTVPDEFPAAQRTVQLDGTAMFRVAGGSDPNARAFAVRVGALTVAGTGAVFTVRHFAGEDGVLVQATEGTVALRDRLSGATQSLAAGQAARFAGGTFTPVNGVARDVAFAWTRDSIVFDGAPLRTVVPELVRWYGMNAALVDAGAGDRPVHMRIALSSSGDAAKALTRAADLVIGFGKDDRIEFRAAATAANKR